MPDRLFVLPPALFSEDGNSLSPAAYVFLLLLCLAFFLPGLATLPPTDRDESLFAQATKQMIEGNNYVDIHFQNEPRYKKPAGIYWLQSLSVKAFNPHHLDQIWAYRLPSLAGATIAVMLTAALGSMLFGPLAGILAAMMMAGSLLLNFEARIAKTDAVLLATVMAAQYAMARVYIKRAVRQTDWKQFFLFWSAIGLGLLIKGPMILLFTGSVLLWLAITEKNLRWFNALKPLLGIPYSMLIAAPWFVTIMMQSHGQFLEQSAGHDMLGKLWQDQGRGFAPPGSYLLFFPVGFFPFALWSLLAMPDTWRNRTQPAIRFCLGWIIPAGLLFELMLTKLPHYVLPIYPAIAMITAKALLDGYPLIRAGRWRWKTPILVSLWIMISGLLVIVGCLFPWVLDTRWDYAQIAAGMLMLVAEGAALMLFFRRRESAVIVSAIGSLVIMLTFFANTLPSINHLWVSRQVVGTAKLVNPCPGQLKLASTYNEPSLVFLGGTNTILHNDSVAIADMMKNDHCIIGAIENNKREAFMQRFDERHQPTQISKVSGYLLGRGNMIDLGIYIFPKDMK